MAEPLITIAEARARVARATGRLPTEEVPVARALNRVLARDLDAAGDTPPFPCSAMDGYAIKHGPAGRTLKVVAESRAGTPSPTPLNDGEAIRISTGAAVPVGADAVIRQEDTDTDTKPETETEIETDADTDTDTHAPQNAIVTLAATAEGENVRHPGEDMKAGTNVLRAGTILGPAEIAAAVAAGAGTLTVSRQPVVQILTTGDELKEPGEPLGPGEIHNSNGPMLAALAAKAGGALTTEPRRLPDDRAATTHELQQALEHADVVIVSGGVSVGPHDHVKPALATLNVEQLFWGVALQPGKPTWFGRRGDDRLVFGLPGNPVSAYVTFTLFALPALLALQGAREAPPHQNQATLGASIRRNPHREQAVRVRLEHRNGVLLAFANGPQASHIVTSLIGADALALIPAGDGRLEGGASVSLEPLPN
jgi:molybdopterin molybdotransferase